MHGVVDLIRAPTAPDHTREEYRSRYPRQYENYNVISTSDFFYVQVINAQDHQ